MSWRGVMVVAGLAASGCGGDSGAPVELLAYDAEGGLGDVSYSVNGETTQHEGDTSLRKEVRIDGDFEIRVDVANSLDVGGVFCGIDAVPEGIIEFSEFGEVSAACVLRGNIDDPSSFVFETEPVMRVADSTDGVTDPLAGEVDADLFTVRIPFEWESTAINLQIDNGTPDPGGLDLEILMRANSDLAKTNGTTIRIDRALDRGNVDLASWNQRFLDDLEATDPDGEAEFTEPTLVTIGEFEGYAARTDQPTMKTFAMEIDGELIMVSARHNARVSPNQVSLESILENMIVN